ncbi:MAG: YggS family pyridoxal phosphate-dependent enzyme [Bacteroidales bacterium]|nr:YggS family pyridoxal phosphate-dependent enzyme [Bacteroidales bacterium]
MSIASQLTELNQKLPSTVKLVAVSKFKPLAAVMEAYDAGQRRFGENRPQEMAAKAVAAPADIEWHFIGHLQTNKVKLVVPYASIIESVDSLKLLGEINRFAASLGKMTDCLLEVHIAREESKQGFSREELLALVPEFGKYPFIRFRGLMGMASNVPDMDQVRSEFRGLRALFEEVRTLGERDARRWVRDFDQLSMGMSHDWPVAVEEGATLIRIGTAIFGPRN